MRTSRSTVRQSDPTWGGWASGLNVGVSINRRRPGPETHSGVSRLRGSRVSQIALDSATVTMIESNTDQTACAGIAIEVDGIAS